MNNSISTALICFIVFFFSMTDKNSSLLYAEQGTVKSSNGEELYLANTIVLKFKDYTSAQKFMKAGSAFSKFIEQLSLVSIKPLFENHDIAGSPLAGIVQIKYSSNIDPHYAARKLGSLPEIQWAEPQFVYPLSYLPNDPSYASQWNLAKIQADKAWDITKGDTTIVIAIIDTGVDWDHPDLAANIWINKNEIPGNGIDDDNNSYTDDIRGWDFGGLNGTPDNNPMEDRPDHGTHVAGIAGAVTDNNTGIASIGFKSKVMAVKTSQDNLRDQSGSALIAYGYQGIVYAVDNGAKVINCSWGGGAYSILGQEVINYTVSKGALVVGAAGNSNSSAEHYPSSYKGVLSVASSTPDDIKSAFSNYGAGVDVTAPGSSIPSTWQNDTYLNISGTSMASPLAAGLAALVFSKFPNYSGIQIGEQIRANTDDINSSNPAYENLLGRGRINAFKALNNTGSISVRAISSSFSDEQPGGNGDGIIQPGEIITVSIKFVNYLNPTSSLNISLISKNSYSSVVNGTFNAGAVASLDSFNNNNSKFTFQVSAAVPSNTDLAFNLIFSDGTYSDYQWINTIGNPSYAVQLSKDIAMTITSKGTLGFNDYPNNQQGVGFKYKDGSNLMFEGAFMMGTASNKVSDAARSSTGQAQSPDFKVLQPFILKVPGSIADQEGTALFDDNGAGANKLGITTKLTSYSFANEPLNNFLILKYNLTNTTAAQINNLYAGIFIDWDFIDGSGDDDFTAFDTQGNLGYAYHVGGNPNEWTAAALISSSDYGYWGILNAGGDGGFQIYDGFTDSEKWQALSNGIGKAQAGAGDVSHVVSGGPFTIPAGQLINVAFVIAAADDLPGLRTAVSEAREKYQEILTSVEKFDDLLPETFSLQQNYPNPFNPATTIQYSIPEESFVELKIYDVLGKEITKLVSEQHRAGNYKVTFNAENYSSGVYFYKLRWGGKLVTKKMVLIR